MHGYIRREKALPFPAMANWIVSTLLVVGTITGYLAQVPVVHVVLFYSSSCIHCAEVIADVVPPLRDQFGDSLDLLYVDVSGGQGAALFRAAGDALSVPDNLKGRVPTVVIGSNVLVGSDQIEGRLEGLIAEGMAAGGVPLPAIPGMLEYDAHIRALKASQALTSSGEVNAPPLHNSPWSERFQHDLIANLFAIGVLALQIASLVVWTLTHLSAQRKRDATLPGWLRQTRMVILSVVWLALLSAAFTLTAGADQSAQATCTAFAVNGLLVMGLPILYYHRQRSQSTEALSTWNLLLLALAGLLVAGYLTRVEVGQNTASCGALGQCNSVQSSQYARLAGTPVGVLGMIGYALLAAAVLGARFVSVWQRQTVWAVRLIAAGGILFSTVLTFLEPFVIGATCLWCVTSALIMLLIGWYALPSAEYGTAPSGPPPSVHPAR